MDRFLIEKETVIDNRTGLMWTKNASLFEFPLDWREAFDRIGELNGEGLGGYRDWKLPNRKELFSLMSHDTINPSLPPGHPFTDVFPGYYWTSSTCARLPDQAWYIHLGGARVFKGMKYGSYMVWPTRTTDPRGNDRLFKTGQTKCFDEEGLTVDCHGTGQDGDIQAGLSLAGNRFTETSKTIRDNRTGLEWLRNKNIRKKMVDWTSAFDLISEMNSETAHGHDDWRVPGIFELESLTDLSRHSPALADGHLFNDVKEFYWSATTSMYDMNYAWVLYTKDGAVGVGHKPMSEFYLWPVRGREKKRVF